MRALTRCCLRQSICSAQLSSKTGDDANSEFALGEADNPHDMQIAAAKAYEALQYTVAVRDKMLDAYKEIMNMQI